MDMLIRADREHLLPALATIGGVVERRQTLPILGNFLFKVADRSMLLIATDLEIEIRTVSTVENGNNRGAFTLPAKKFSDICKALPEGSELEISIEEDRVLIRSERTRFTLGILPAMDYPSIEMIAAEITFEIGEAVLKQLFERTAFSMAQQDVRYYLNGMLLELSPKRIRCVATDGHRLAMCEVAIEVGQDNRQILLPRKAVLELLRLLSYSERVVGVEASVGFCRFRLGDETVFTTKLIDGRFPDYDRVIPKNLNKMALVCREDLKNGLARASILSGDKYKGIRLTFGVGVLNLQAHNPEQDEAQEEIEIEYHDDEIAIGFNLGYLWEILGIMNCENVSINFIDGESSAVIRDPDDSTRLYVVMPMRL